MTTLKIKVTKDVLERSKYCGVGENIYNMAKNCAIAVAVRDIFPKATVCNSVIYFDESVDSTSLSRKVTSFINKFDDLVDTPLLRTNLPEFQFTIKIPDSVIERINIDELKPLLINHPTLELITQ